MPKQFLLGATVTWLVEGGPDSLRIQCRRGEETHDVPAPWREAPLQVWSEGDDLLLQRDAPVRLRPDGSRSDAPPAEAGIAWRERGRRVGLRYDAALDACVPLDVRTGAALGPEVSFFDRERVAAIRGAVWRYDHGELWIGGREVRLDQPLGDGTIAATPDALLVRHQDGIDRIDAGGHCERLATTHGRPGIFDRELFTDGRSVAWVETGETTVEVKSVPVRGGDVEVLLARRLPEAVRIVDAYRGRVLLQEEREIVSGVLRRREAGGLLVLEFPAVPDEAGVGAKPATGPTLHDDVARLPVRTELAARLHAAGLHRVADAEAQLRESKLAPADEAELLYAVTCFSRHVADPAKPLAPIDPRFLAAATELELSPAARKKVAARAPTIAHVVTRTEAEWLKTSGFSRATLAALRAALEKLGLGLGMRWWELGSKGEEG